MSQDKECFIICPIGSEGSDTRERSDKLMEFIISDAVSEYGYSVTRADQMTDPGSITNAIIQKVVESDLVIADLSGHNPNVFYELAVRHATGKPYIQLIDSSESIPFDIADIRTIKYDFDVGNANRAIEEIQQHIETLEDEEPEYDNPISRSAELNSLRTSGDPTQETLAEIVEGLNQLNMKVERLGNEPTDILLGIEEMKQVLRSHDKYFSDLPEEGQDEIARQARAKILYDARNQEK